MKPILSIAAAAAFVATMAAAPMLSNAQSPKKTPIPLTPAASENPCADTSSSSWAAGNASSRQARPSQTPVPQHSCAGLRTVIGEDAAVTADTRGNVGDNSGAVGAKTAEKTDVDGFIGMGTTKPPAKK